MSNQLKDSFGRVLDYLRISVTDRCNLGCIYCMPPEGVEWKPHENILTFEQIIRIVNILSELGIKKIRVTGGEPLLRHGISWLIKELKSIRAVENTALTTNGILLGGYLDEADTACLPDSVNISLNALNSGKYNLITRCGSAQLKQYAQLKQCAQEHYTHNILTVIDRLLEKKINVKINCVPMCGINEDEIVSLAALAKDKDIDIRFIELMPVGCASNLQPVPGAETAQLIEKIFGTLTPFNRVRGNGPAVYYSLPNFKGKVGFINAVTHGFCENCNRLRLTPEGFLKLCLSNSLGVDLRKMIREGSSDSSIADAITEAVLKKPRFHTLSDIYCEKEQHRESMSKIGG